MKLGDSALHVLHDLDSSSTSYFQFGEIVIFLIQNCTTRSLINCGKELECLALALFHLTHKTSLMVSYRIPKFSRAFRMLRLSTPNNFATPLLLAMDELYVSIHYNLLSIN